MNIFKTKRDENINKAKKENNIENKMIFLCHHPELWKLDCTDCGSEIKFEKYHRFQNAKSAIKRGKNKYCEKCKDEKIGCHNTKNPLDWKVNCKSCNKQIYYKSYDVYRTQFRKEIECKECNLNSRRLIIRKDREYSRNPEDWKNKCGNDNCQNIIIYTTLKSYQGAMKRIKDGNSPCCLSCVSKRRPVCSLENAIKRELNKKLNCKKTFLKNEFANFNKQERKILKREFNISDFRVWVEFNDSERNNIKNNLKLFLNSILVIYDENKRNEQSNRARNRILNTNSKAKVKPYFNLRSINFIETELNQKFNTKFIHAMSENGEFRIFDSLRKKVYFADAYCPILNLWIEIDEKAKFRSDVLDPAHKKRHEYIQEILKCKIIRYREYKTNAELKYVEYIP